MLQNETAAQDTSVCTPRSVGVSVLHPQTPAKKVAALPIVHTADASLLRTAMGWVLACLAIASQAA